MSDPAVVLIHGAFADASSWRGLYAALAGDGLDVRAPANPLRGVTAGDAAYTQSVLGAIDGPVVLVGRS
jgi:pimeloyl-ACP methyl ester carboxylesterase